jgi:uncharacterized protein DUF2334
MVTCSDLERNVRLHLGEEVEVAALSTRARALLTPARVPARSVRLLQRVAMKRGLLDWERQWLAPLMSVRRQFFGERASGAPRFLVRVDEFPYATAFDQPDDREIEMSRRFHDVMCQSGVAHLMAIVSQLTHAPFEAGSQGGRPLGRDEITLIERMRGDHVTFAQHGTTHRTRFASPRKRSELCGLVDEQLDALLELGRERLAEVGVDARVFVPPFNRFDAAQYPLLARRFEVVCGGPESVALLGFHGGPLWRGEALYLPCYPPLYASARTLLPIVERMIQLQPGTWVPVVLHTSWERDDDFVSLRRLAKRIAPFAVEWTELLAAAQDSTHMGSFDAPS